jgi:hypothetical protein
MLIELGVVFILSESRLAINFPRTFGFAGKETSALTDQPLAFAMGRSGYRNRGAKA